MTSDGPLRILVAGPPGTGKTTVAGVLAGRLGCDHFDMERDPANRNALASYPAAFLASLPDTYVVSWGFSPVTDAADVDLLTSSRGGFRMVWLDGDRVASFRAFMEREGGDPMMEWRYYLQMFAILTRDVAARHRAVRVNPFKDGSFRPADRVADRILEALR
jgi:hypothetical protein